MSLKYISHFFGDTLYVMIMITVQTVIFFSLQVWMNQTADNHIFKFVKNKFTTDSTDFESQLYLCNEAFQVVCLSIAGGAHDFPLSGWTLVSMRG